MLRCAAWRCSLLARSLQHYDSLTSMTFVSDAQGRCAHHGVSVIVRDARFATHHQNPQIHRVLDPSRVIAGLILRRKRKNSQVQSQTQTRT